MENYDSPKRILVTGGGVFSVHTSVKITVNNKEFTLWPYDPYVLRIWKYGRRLKLLWWCLYDKLFSKGRLEYMPRITLKETITKEIEIPMDTLCDIIDKLSEEEKTKLLERVKTRPIKLKPFKKDKIDAILVDFEATKLYENDFLKDLKEGLKKSSAYK